jgi:hypothetical protein
MADVSDIVIRSEKNSMKIKIAAAAACLLLVACGSPMKIRRPRREMQAYSICRT